MDNTETVKITLAQALKFKKRLVGKMQELFNLAVVSNVYFEDDPLPESKNARTLLEKYFVLSEAVVTLKAIIEKANLPQAYNLAKLAESKSTLSNFRMLSTTTGIQHLGLDSKGVQVIRRRVAFLEYDDVKAITNSLESTIASLQDELDTFNASTKVTIPACINEFCK